MSCRVRYAGETQMSCMLWTTTLETTEDKQIQENARQHLWALRVDEDVTAPEKIAEAYHDRVVCLRQATLR